MKLITAGSFSRLDVFSQCKHRAELAFIEKIKEPDRGPPPRGKTEWANDRGSRIHDEGEFFMKGKLDKFPADLKHFRPEFHKLRELYEKGNVLGEEMWCYDNAWNAVEWNDWDNVWMRIKTDATVFLSKEEAVVIDYKTGQKFGNEIKHAQQAQLYCVGALIRFPELQSITTELWYLDQDEISTMHFTRKQGLHFFRYWNERNLEMTNCEDFPPNPNASNCRWCPYTPNKSGHCSVGV